MVVFDFWLECELEWRGERGKREMREPAKVDCDLKILLKPSIRGCNGKLVKLFFPLMGL